MYNDLIGLGFKPNKEDRLKLPVAPKEYISHFIRGYFDGDGGISWCFAHANLSFLKKVSNILRNNACLGKGCLDKKTKHLNYSKLDSKKLFYYMYKEASKAQYLERKYNKFQEAFKLVGPSSSLDKTRDCRSRDREFKSRRPRQNKKIALGQ